MKTLVLSSIEQESRRQLRQENSFILEGEAFQEDTMAVCKTCDIFKFEAGVENNIFTLAAIADDKTIGTLVMKISKVGMYRNIGLCFQGNMVCRSGELSEATGIFQKLGEMMNEIAITKAVDLMLQWDGDVDCHFLTLLVNGEIDSIFIIELDHCNLSLIFPDGKCIHMYRNEYLIEYKNEWVYCAMCHKDITEEYTASCCTHMISGKYYTEPKGDKYYCSICGGDVTELVSRNE